MSAYVRFGSMIIVASVIMYPLMYLNTYSWEHVFWSETRFYMTLLMTASMAVIMLIFMNHMLKDRRINGVITATSLLVFAGALYLVRSQRTVEDLSWMKAMIPHHSIAILTSERAKISDPRVRQLADEIIAAQKREIEEMQGYIKDIEGNRTTSADQPITH